MNPRCFYKRPRFGFAAVAHIAFADEDDELLEPWMIGPAMKSSGNGRHAGNRAPSGLSAALLHDSMDLAGCVAAPRALMDKFDLLYGDGFDLRDGSLLDRKRFCNRGRLRQRL